MMAYSLIRYGHNNVYILDGDWKNGKMKAESLLKHFLPGKIQLEAL